MYTGGCLGARRRTWAYPGGHGAANDAQARMGHGATNNAHGTGCDHL